MGNESEVVYRYILDQAKSPGDCPTSEVLYQLLVDLTPTDPTVRQALLKIAERPDFKGKEALLFINRAVYSAINRMHLDASRQGDLQRLVKQLAEAPDTAHNPATRALRRALRAYVQDEMYQCVLRQVRLSQPEESKEAAVVGDLLQNYPFLYVSTMVTSDIKQLENQASQKNRETSQLTEGVQYRRRLKIYQDRQALSQYWTSRHQDGCQPIINPTRLSNEGLDQGIKLYHTRRPGSFRHRANQLIQRHHAETSMARCRDDILHYMTGSLKLLKLEQAQVIMNRCAGSLQLVEPDTGMMQSTLIQAFRRILDSLMFMDFDPAQGHRLLQNHLRAFSPCKYAAILLSLVLGCPMIVYTLEQRLTALYLHHEQAKLDSLTWLVEFFEYMQLALVINHRYLLNYNYQESQQMPQTMIWIE